MRKLPAVVAVLGLAALGLTGCSVGAPSCTRVADSDPAVTHVIRVSGTADARPRISVATPFHTAGTQWADVTTGSGTPITSGSQLVVLDITVAGGDNGKTLVSTAYDGGLTSVFSVSQWNQQLPGLQKALQCATAGSRVKVAFPGGALDPSTAASWGLSADESVVAVVDVRKVYLARATGLLLYNSGFGLPSIVRAPNGRPGVIVPDGAAPDHVVVQTLVKGDGKKVTGDDPLRLAYTSVDWSTKQVSDTTWDGAPRSVTLSTMPKGVQNALKGQTVGSQLMIVVPKKDLGAGATDTLVYVIDILGVDAPGTPSSSQ